jgi:ornithine cyclodeaminase
MHVLVLSGTEIASLLPMDACIDRLDAGFRALARGEAILPLRHIHRDAEGRGALGLMPAWVTPLGALGVKVISVFPGNLGTPLDTHQGAVLLFEAEAGRLLAILDASAITAVRTAAASALATRVLARADARVLAVLGSGVQGRSHLEALPRVRRFTEVRLWSRDGEQAERLARWGNERLGLPVRVVPAANEAVAGADVICTATGAVTPIVEGVWLEPGAHVNAVGACTPRSRELDTEAVRRSRLFTDRTESLLHEAGDFLIPLQAGELEASHVAGELGDVLIGRVPGRTNPTEITLFKSLGIGVEDVVAAHEAYRRARETGAGTWVELGGERPV